MVWHCARGVICLSAVDQYQTDSYCFDTFNRLSVMAKKLQALFCASVTRTRKPDGDETIIVQVFSSVASYDCSPYSVLACLILWIVKVFRTLRRHPFAADLVECLMRQAALAIVTEGGDCVIGFGRTELRARAVGTP
jgi:hypothetical protein